jgi:hypothetical protein
VTTLSEMEAIAVISQKEQSYKSKKNKININQLSPIPSIPETTTKEQSFDTSQRATEQKTKKKKD